MLFWPQSWLHHLTLYSCFNVSKSCVVQYSPFPGTQVNNNEAGLLVAVDVMEKTHRSGSEFIVDVFSWMLPRDVYPSLQKRTQHTGSPPHAASSVSSTSCVIRNSTYAFLLVRFKAVHVVGSADSPGAQELQQVDFNRRLDKDKVVFWHPKTRERHGLSCVDLATNIAHAFMQ